MQIADDKFFEYWLFSELIQEPFPIYTLQTNPNDDLLLNLIRHELGESEAKKRVNLLNDAENNIEQLIIKGNYLKALAIINKSINEYPNRFACLPLWCLRILLCMRLKDFTIVDEIEGLSNFDYPEFYINDNKQQNHFNLTHSIVPFSFRLLYALFPALKKEYQTAITRLTKLLEHTLKIYRILEEKVKVHNNELTYKNESISNDKEICKTWKARLIRIQLCLAASHVQKGDYVTAFDMVKNIITTQSLDNQGDTTINMASILRLKLYLVRILIQLGNLSLAKEYLDDSQDSLTANEKILPDSKFLSGQLSLHIGLLEMANNNFVEAQTAFYESFNQSPVLKPIALNNIALAHLYSGNMKQGISLLEKEMDADPECLLQESIIFNLCSMYELQSSNNIYYKRILLQKVARIKGDGFNPECFKLS